MADTVVFYPYPSVGHLFSMAELAKLIRRHRPHLSLTLLYGAVPSEPAAFDAAVAALISSNPSIAFLRLPHRPIDTSQPISPLAIRFQSIRNSSADFAAALRRLSDSGARIRAVVVDLFCSTALPVAAELGIPVYYFFTSGAAVLAAYLHMPAVDLRAPGLMIELPGLPPIPAPEMPQPLLDVNDPAYGEMIYFCRSLAESKGILVNTFDELEPVAMAAISGGDCVPEGRTPPVFNIGPLTQASEEGDDDRLVFRSPQIIDCYVSFTKI